MFWQSKLYFDSGLQAIYIVLGLLGWYWWLHGRSAGSDLPVTHTSRLEAKALLSVAAIATAALWFGQARWTNGALPFWDASTTVVSLVAQYMLMKKLFENWWLWIAVDVAYVGMYASLDLYLTAALQPLFILLCVQGIREWRASMVAAAPPTAVRAAGL